MSSYIQNRDAERRIKLLDKTIESTSKQLAKNYQISAKRIRRTVEALYTELLQSSDDGTILISDLYKYNRYYDLLFKLNKELNALGNKEVKLFGDKFEALYLDNSKLIGKQFNLATSINKEDAHNVINTIWCADGKTWSSRIWTNHRQLSNTIQQSLIDAVSTGKSVGDVAKFIDERFNVGYSNAERLARTELAYIQNQSTLDTYRDIGITEYEILVEDDACDECQELAVKKYSIEDLVIPAHPNCRCCAVPVI